MADIMEIGLFQMENLFLNPNRFVFLDIRESRAAAHPAVDKLVDQAKPIAKASVRQFLADDKIPLEFPVVLVCQDGHQSQALAEELTAAGFINIYVVAGGVVGLLSEV